MTALRPAQPADAAIVAAWPLSEDESRLWCSLPEVDAGLVAEWSDAGFGLIDGGELVGYGELWIDHDEAEVELARLIVAPAHRGRGIGRRLAAALAGLASTHYPAIFMRVHPDNTAALRCYASAGFSRVGAAEADEWNRGQPTRYVWLRI
ncbi:MAG TPA: GNAT family N-acetyltransferase [Actinokineospora sp.]|jgi:ribosomal protein S18 acetylase RimI-like enzyme|nr:GNAT family N-acetyltransferase [Actinokineospora sp.]